MGSTWNYAESFVEHTLDAIPLLVGRVALEQARIHRDHEVRICFVLAFGERRRCREQRLNQIRSCLRRVQKGDRTIPHQTCATLGQVLALRETRVLASPLELTDCELAERRLTYYVQWHDLYTSLDQLGSSSGEPTSVRNCLRRCTATNSKCAPGSQSGSKCANLKSRIRNFAELQRASSNARHRSEEVSKFIIFG